MALVIYYAAVLLVTIAAWPWTYGTREWTRVVWVSVGLMMLVLPAVVPTKAAIYYGLLGNTTVLFWTADTYLGKEDRRFRAFTGAALLPFLPLLWRWPLESRLGCFLVPTLGHVLISGVVWGLLGRPGAS